MCGRCAKPIQLAEDLSDSEKSGLNDLIQEINSLSTEATPPTLEEASNTWPLPESARKAVQDHVRASKTSDSHTNDNNAPFSWLRDMPTIPSLQIQHPLCQECAQVSLDLMIARANEVKAEVDTLTLMEREMERLALVDGDLEMSQEDMNRWRREQDTIAHEIDSMNAEVQRLKETLESYDRDHSVLKKQLQSLESETGELDNEEEQFWHRYEALQSETEQLASDEARIREQIENEKILLESLQVSDAYLDAFCIEEDASGMGTINDLRLGRLMQRGPKTDQIEWTEINAALGQVALLLTVLERLMKYTFKQYKVIPRCSISCIETTGSEKATYELYGTNDWQIGRLLHSRRFDHGMAGVLTCVKELGDYAHSVDPSFQLPYLYVKMV